MFETSKSVIRRSYDKRFATRWLVGDGIDIGCGPDSIAAYMPLFPLIRSVRSWDIEDGDAQFMDGVPDNTFDFVHSSHCLEHLYVPMTALENWIRICKPGGHLLIIVPDEDLYEQGEWPSTMNTDHKCTFTIAKHESWSPVSVNVAEQVRDLAEQVEVLKIELLDTNYFYGVERADQTLSLVGECAIEIILRKRPIEAATSPAG